MQFRHFKFVILLLSLLASAGTATANDAVSATIQITVSIPAQNTLGAMTQRDACTQLLLESPDEYLTSNCGMTLANHFVVQQTRQDLLVVEPI